jgi:hypothetical protein
MIRFIDNTNDTYGNGISIGGGGLTIMGSGESADAIASGKSGGDENLYLGSDGTAYIYTNVQNGLSSAKTFTFGANGTLTATTFSGSGASLTSLNASNLASGTVSSARLPVATSSALGAVKIGSGVTITDGVISVTAANLGLSKAMRFIGVATVAITDGSTTDPVISGYSTKTAGDVIIDKDSSREYVWSTTSKWELLGGDSSYKTTQSTVDSGAAATNKWVSRI